MSSHVLGNILAVGMTYSLQKIQTVVDNIIFDVHTVEYLGKPCSNLESPSPLLSPDASFIASNVTAFITGTKMVILLSANTYFYKQNYFFAGLKSLMQKPKPVWNALKR